MEHDHPHPSVHAVTSIVAYGDCNTLGYQSCEHDAYPERLADLLSVGVLNLGRTMATTRELLCYAKDCPPDPHSLVIINYGLVDSWLTFRYAPYVLYYPDNPLRRVLRVAVKKIKRICTRSGIAARLGPAHVVPPDEFERNVDAVVSTHPGVAFVLLSAFPNMDESRNPAIRTYNATLARIARKHPENTIYLDLYAALFEQKSRFFCEDGTHINGDGHDFVARSIAESLEGSSTFAGELASTSSGSGND